MKKTMRRLFAILMTLAIAITAIPMTEVKAETTKDVRVEYTYVGENNVIETDFIMVSVTDGMTYYDLIQYIPALDAHPYISFEEWECLNITDLSKEISEDCVSFMATYNKYPVWIDFVYVNSDNMVTVKELFTGYYEKGSTWDSVYNTFVAGDVSLSTTYAITDWDKEYSDDTIIDLRNCKSKEIADYADYNIVEFRLHYIESQDGYGIQKEESIYKLFENATADTAGNGLNTYFEAEIVPNMRHLENMGTVDWHIDKYDYDGDGQAEVMDCYALYSGKKVVVDDGNEAKFYPATSGAEIPLPESLNGRYITWKCNVDQNEYKSTYTVPSTVTEDIMLTPVFGEWMIDRINVTIQANVSEIELTDESPRATIMWNMKVDIDGYIPNILNAYMGYWNVEAANISADFITSTPDPYSNSYQAWSSCDVNVVSGEYNFDYLVIELEDETVINTFDNNFAVSAPTIEVVNKITDTTAPVISNVKMNVEKGTKIDNAVGGEVVVSFKITDEGVGVNENIVYVEFFHPMTLQGTGIISAVSLGNGMYQATFVVNENIENGEWVLDEISVQDKVGNRARYLPEQCGEDFYFYVTENGEYEPTVFKDVVLNFYDEVGELIHTKKVTEAPRRATISELLGEYPVYETELGFLGWSASEFGDLIITSDTEIGFRYDDEELNFYPVTEKIAIDVAMEILDENGESEWIDYETYFIQRNATYQDLTSMIEKPKDVMECKFVKWDIPNVIHVDLTDKISTDWVVFDAVYDKYPVMIERVYIDNTGATKSEIITKVYPSGTTMASICDEFAVTPSDASSRDVIKGWDTADRSEETVSLDNNMIYMEARYDNKSFVEVNYSYYMPIDNYGKIETIDFFIAVDNDIANVESELLAYCKENLEKEIDAKHYEKYGFGGWEYVEVIDYDEDGNIDSVYAKSIIDNTEHISVRLYVGAEVYVYVAEAGEMLILPWENDEYYLEWYYKEGVDGWYFVESYQYQVPLEAVNGKVYMLMADEIQKLNGKPDESVSITDENKVLPSGITLRAVHLKEGRNYIIAKELMDANIQHIQNHAIYDITLVDANGKLVELLNGKIKVTIDLPFDVTEGNLVTAYRVDGDKLVECETMITDNVISFETDHFSTYVFVEREKEEVATPPGGNEKPGDEIQSGGDNESGDDSQSEGEATPPAKAPETGDVVSVLPYMLLLLFGAGVYMVGKKI